MKQRIKNAIVKICAYSLLFSGGFFFLLGAAMWIEGDPRYFEAGRGLSIVSLVLVIPGVFMALKTRKIDTRNGKIDHVVQLIRSHRRISLDLLAEKTGLALSEVEELLSASLKRNMISGKVDRTTGEFYTDGGGNRAAAMKNCPSCGGSLAGPPLEGDTMKCRHCGNVYS